MSHYKLVTQSYPRTYWEDHGDEILDTANELHNDNWSFKESRELLSNGLRTRGNEATQGEVKQVFAQGAAIWLLFVFFVSVSWWSWDLFGPPPSSDLYNFPPADPVWLVAAQVITVFTLAFTTRWPAMLSIAVVDVIAYSFTTDLFMWPIPVLTTATAAIVVRYGNSRRVISPKVFASLTIAAVAMGGIWPGIYVGWMFAFFFVAVVTAMFDARLLAAATIAFLTFAINWVFFTFDNFQTQYFNSGVAVFTIAFAVLSIIVVKTTQRSARRI